MKRIVTFCALCALWGCRQVVEPSGEVIALSYSTSEQSKTDVLTSGDQIGVFASIEGTENCFLDNAKYVVGSDGRSLSTGSAVYYPDPKQAVRFFACFPYHTGTFSVPTDQSRALALQQADLCWAAASSTPVARAVPLEFTHQMARLLITTNQPTTKIVAPNLFSGGTLNIRTGVFTNTLKSDISTTGNELIVPVQPLARLVLTVSGVEYVFDTAPIALQAGQTTTLNLTLNPTTKTATLSGSSTTNWVSSASEGNPTQVVANTFTVHWLPNAHHLSAAIDRIVFTINGADYAVSSEISYANNTFTVPFSSVGLIYPYTISKISFYQSTQLVQSCTNLLGRAIYKSGASTVGIKDVPINWVKIGNLWWATGNLVASNSTAGGQGVGGCKIGAPGDGGLYFQFGSLIGWKGGALDNGGTGVGMSQAANGTYWNGAAVWGWDNEAMVWPSVMSPLPSAWPQSATTNQWYFGLQSGWSTSGQNIRDFPNLATGGLANVGVGDPCSYYLGSIWRLPTGTEYGVMCNNQSEVYIGYTWAQAGGSWTTSPVNGGNLSNSKLFFPASGARDTSNGSFYTATALGYGWSNSISVATHGFYLGFANSIIYPQYGTFRSYGLPIRCVSSVAP